MFEKSIEKISPEHSVRLTKKEDKVVQIEIYVDEKQRCQIFDYFPDKTLGWKDAAPHFIILKHLAAYKNHALTHPTQKNASLDNLTEVVKELCHATAPLYSLVNRSYFDGPDFLLNSEWKQFKEKNAGLDLAHLKLNFLIQQLDDYEQKVAEIFSKDTLPLEIKILQAHQQNKIKKFIEDVKKNAEISLNQEQVQKLFSNQNQSDVLDLPSLGNFLRTQAKTLMGDGIAFVDEITKARFDQLFSFSTDPLRKQFVSAKSDLEKQLSTHAVRFINSQACIPKGQLDVIKGYNLNSKSEKGWMDIMPYVNAKAFWGEGIGGNEGLYDVDQILNVYAHSQASETIVIQPENSNLDPELKRDLNDPSQKNSKEYFHKNTIISLKKPSFWFYQIFIDMLSGKKGALEILGAVLFGLPIFVLAAVGLLAAMSFAMAVDLAAFMLQAGILAAFSPLLVLGVVGDFILQLPSFFTQKLEFKFSFLAKMATWPIPPEKINHLFRQLSLVRRLKQLILDQYSYCEVIDEVQNESEPLDTSVDTEKFVAPKKKESLTKLLDEVKNNQAEGLFNVVATQFFTFATIASFLHIKLKQIVYAVRELRKVLGRVFDVVFLGGAEKALNDHINQLTKVLHNKVKDRYEKISSDFVQAIEDQGVPAVNSESDGLKSNAEVCNKQHWIGVTPWNARQSENPLDFISDIGLGLVHQLVDPAFENNPGVATPAFVASIGCFTALLFPAVGNVFSAQILGALKFLPESIAKAFMGKSLEAGLATIPTNLISVFLQWKLIYFGSEALTALYHGDIEWIKKIFENPEEITLSAGIFVAMGYGVGLIPDLPADFNIALPNDASPFLKGITAYLEGIGNGFSNAFNLVAEESREVTHQGMSGPNALELAFIGLKSSMLFYGLLSGTHQVSIKPLEIDREKLDKNIYVQFKSAKNTTEKQAVIARMLSQHGIVDTDSKLAEKITQALEKIQQPAKSKESPLSGVDPESTFINARNELRNLVTLVNDIEILGMPIDSENTSGEMGYRSNADGELMYNTLFAAIERHNQAARRLGLFHEQIDGQNLLHNFYNKHCYTGSSGWHKILFGILLFPITWAWRGFKYLIGTPAMRHQVKKSFSKDFAMLFQLIPDVIAPILRTLLKSILYAVRMFLGVLLLPSFLIAVTGIAFSLVIGLILTPFAAAYAAIVATQAEEGAKTFVSTMQAYFGKVTNIKNTIWQVLLCGDFANGYMKWVSLVGSTAGTGSLHRLNPLKAIGVAALYERLTATADTTFDNLCAITSDLRQHLTENSADDLVNKRKEVMQIEVQKTSGSEKMTYATALQKLIEYDTESENYWLPRSSERTGQLQHLSGLLFAPSPQPIQESLKPVLESLKGKGKLAEKLNAFI